jgi:hypothetical protein
VTLRALVLVIVALTLAACTSSQTVATENPPIAVPTTTKPLLAVDLSATPTGWVPVAYGDAQVSVPATWWVRYNSGCPTGSPRGEVLVTQELAWCPVETADGQGPKTVVWLTLLVGLGSGYRHRSVINGFSVYDDVGTYFVPSLHLQLGISGPLAQRVLRTLTRSPRAVALASGPAPSVPQSWRRVTSPVCASRSRRTGQSLGPRLRPALGPYARLPAWRLLTPPPLSFSQE